MQDWNTITVELDRVEAAMVEKVLKERASTLKAEAAATESQLLEELAKPIVSSYNSTARRIRKALDEQRAEFDKEMKK